MKEWFAANKVKVCVIIGVLLLLSVAGIAIGLHLRGDDKTTVAEEPGKTTDEEPKTQETWSFKQYKYEAPGYLDNYDDIGVMIMDCDAKSSFKRIENALFTSRENEYVQGTGALNLVNLRYKDLTPWAHLEPVDISDYAKGSVHVALYVSDPKYLGGKPIVLELTSGGVQDKDELSWYISPVVLHAGWNELYLGIEDARLTGKPDLKAINFFRTYASGGSMGLQVYMDAVYATNTPGMDVNGPVEYATAKPGYLLDFDTLKGLSSDGTMTLSEKEGGYKEGIAAVSVKNPTLVWVSANMNPTDITEYRNGKISFWMYIDNAASVRGGKIVVELTSSGTCDINEIAWSIPGDSLNTGWNEVTLSLASVNKTGGEIDYSKVNYFRIYGTECSNQLSVILDGVKLQKSVTRVAADGVIADCDTMDAFLSAGGSITNAEGEYKQGSGALKLVQTDNVWWIATLKELVDVSSYAEGGISMWLYVDDAAKLKTTLQFELTSGGTFDVDEYQWEISGLKTGWNQVRLAFAEAKTKGNPNLKGLNFMRLTGQISGEAVIILDDIRAIANAGEVVPDGTTVDTEVEGMIFSGDSFKYASVYSESLYEITREEGEYVQGTGAFKSTGAGQIRLQGKLKEAKDISAYQEGGIEFSLYLRDKSLLKATSLLVELTSAGKADAEELCWEIPLKDLKDGWNTVRLKFEDVASKTGTIDYTRVDYFRMYLNAVETNTNIVFIIDDMHALPKDAFGDEPEIEGMILDCDSTKKVASSVLSNGVFSITESQEEHKQGTGAFKSVGTTLVWWGVKLKEKVDITAYKDGALHLWLYVSDPTLITASSVAVELGSGGTNDVDELEWRIPTDSLKTGWQEIYLDFGKVNGRLGKTDLSKIDWFRVYGAAKTGLTVMVDDVRATLEKGDDKVTEWIIYKDVTIPNTGQFITKGLGLNLNKTAEDKKNLMLYLKINIPEKVYNTINALYIELCQAEADKYEYQFTIKKSELKAGENVLELPWTRATESGGANGVPSLGETMNYCRIYANAGGTTLNGTVIHVMKVVESLTTEVK